MPARERHMKLSAASATLTAAIGLVFSPASSTFAEPSTPAPQDDCSDGAVETDGRDLATLTQVSLLDAIAAVRQQADGEVVEAELEGCHGAAGSNVWFEIAIVGDGALRELRVDASSGEVVGATDEAEDEDHGELARYMRVLRHAELSLEQLIASGQAVVNGTLVEAELEFDDGQPVAELVFANGRSLIEVEVEGRTGHITEIKLEGLEANDDDDDDHRHRGRC